MTEQMKNRKTGARTAAEWMYAALTGVTLLGSLAAMLSWSTDWVTPMWLTVLRCIAAGAALALWDRKDRGFRILIIYLALVFLRLMIPSPEKLFDQTVSQTLFNGAWSFIACYSLAHILGRKKTELFLKVFLTCWVLFMACFSGTGIYAAWADRRIWNIGQGAYWGLYIVSGESSSRLNMFFDANTSGILAAIAAVAAFLCAIGCRHRWMKGVYALLFLPNWTALALTDSRTAQISAAAGIGTVAGILILRKIHSTGKERKRVLAWTAAVFGTLMTMAVCMCLLLGTTSAFNAAKTARGGLLPGAAAESTSADDNVLLASVTPKKKKAGFGETIRLKAKAQNAEGETGFQWQYSTDGETWTDLTTASATRKTLKIKVNTSTYKRKYRCVITAENGTATSNEAVIVKPYSVTISKRTGKSAGGDTVTLTAKAKSAKKPVSYRWQVSDDKGKTWTAVPDGEGRGKTLTVEVGAEKRYRCVVTAANGKVISSSKTIRKASGTTVTSRGLTGNNLLTGRIQVWKQTVHFLAEHPATLLTGRSVAETMSGTGIRRAKNTVTEHCHNMFLQTLMESGIPGLILMIAFMICTGKRAFRLIMTEDRPMLLVVPAAVCSLWTGELTECIVRMFNTRVPTLAMLMLYAGIVCAFGSGKKTMTEEKK